MLDTKAKMLELRLEKSMLSNRIFYIDQEISQLQTQCTHTMSVRGERTLEPRYAYDQAYAYDSSGVRVIETRSVVCDCCGMSRTEMRYTDGDWMESLEWEKYARELKRVDELSKMKVRYEGDTGHWDGLTYGNTYKVIGENELQYIIFPNDLGAKSTILKSKFNIV